ncbi:interferon-induced protein with tetratricopeptide repeats 5-like [Pyxicephalus adspersus]|uniref:interferon-induced protein with tetratricopeptide repeats 5-like n=1 Tax=Pyxicephalus adspersus TaxID=30357 RepID=UPI003B5C13C7
MCNEGVCHRYTPCTSPGSVNMADSESPYNERLQRLECQFTWNLERNDKLNIPDILQTLEVKIQHAAYRNALIMYNVKAYLLHQLRRSTEALSCLERSLEQLRRDHQASADHHFLTIYGNYAWIYYDLNNFHQVDVYLDKFQEISSRLSFDLSHSAHTFAERGWSLLEVGIRNGYQAATLFKKALELYPDENDFLAGLAFSTSSHAEYSEDADIRKEAIRLLDQLVMKCPHNWEAKACLAKMLQDTGHRKNLAKARKLMDDDFQECSNPEVLRIIAGLYRIIPFRKSLEILERAKHLAPDYHKLVQEIGHLYRHQIYHLIDDGRLRAIEEASKFYTAAIELMPWNMSARMDLAEMYALQYKNDLEGIIYSMISSVVESLSKDSKQRFYLQYGIYFLYKIHRPSSGIEILKKGFQIKPNSKFGVKCKKNLTYYILLDRTKEEEIDGFISELEDARRSK